MCHCAQNQKKLACHSWEKSQTDGQTDKQTDGQTNSDFIGPSVGQGSKKEAGWVANAGPW